MPSGFRNSPSCQREPAHERRRLSPTRTLGLALFAAAGCVVVPLDDGGLPGDDVLPYGGYVSAPGATIEISIRDPATGDWDVAKTVDAGTNGTTIAGDTLYRFDTTVDIGALGASMYGTETAEGTSYQLRSHEVGAFNLAVFDEQEIDCVFDNLSELGWVGAGYECSEGTALTIVDRLYGPANGWAHAAIADVPPGLSGTVVAEGETAANFTLNDQVADQVELYQFYGNVVVIDLFTAWCGYCKTNAPGHQEFWAEHEDEGLVFAALMMEDIHGSPPTTNALQQWVDEYGLTHPVLSDPFGWTSVIGWPTYVILDREMQVVDVSPGFFDEALVESLLAE